MRDKSEDPREPQPETEGETFVPAAEEQPAAEGGEGSDGEDESND
jgi:hypothetical protein